MSRTHPIYIASRGRAATAKTPRLLAEDGLRFLVFVEPHESAAYREQFGDRVHELPESNQGLCYVRNAILDHARARGVDWFWMLDDDIDGFWRQFGRRSVRSSAGEALAEAEILLCRDDVATGALEYQQYVWSASRDVAFNGYCDVAVLIHAQRTRPVRFRPDADLKLDRDFTLLVVANGFGLAARSCRIGFSCPKNGTNQGGLAEAYASDGREARSSAAMARLWPGLCEPKTKPDGRPDVKIHWSKLRPRAVPE